MQLCVRVGVTQVCFSFIFSWWTRTFLIGSKPMFILGRSKASTEKINFSMFPTQVLLILINLDFIAEGSSWLCQLMNSCGQWMTSHWSQPFIKNVSYPHQWWVAGINSDRILVDTSISPNKDNKITKWNNNPSWFDGDIGSRKVPSPKISFFWCINSKDRQSHTRDKRRVLLAGTLHRGNSFLVLTSPSYLWRTFVPLCRLCAY